MESFSGRWIGCTRSSHLPVLIPLLASLSLISSIAFSQALPQTLESSLAEAAKLEKNQDYAAAEKIYQQALITIPHQPEILKRMGILYQEELEFQKSVDALQQALQAVWKSIYDLTHRQDLTNSLAATLAENLAIQLRQKHNLNDISSLIPKNKTKM